MDLLNHLLRVAWRESRILTRIVYIALIAGPGFLATSKGQALLERVGLPGTVEPAWSVAAAAFVAMVWLVWSLGRLSYRQACELTPTLELDFLPDGGGVVTTPEKLKTKDGATVAEWEAVYVRVRVVASSPKGAQRCTAHLVSVQKMGRGDSFVATHFTDPIQLVWSGRGLCALDIPYRVPMHVDLLTAKSTDNVLTFAAPWPLTLREFFSDKTTYRFEIVVSADGLSRSIIVDVHWQGDCKTIRCSKVRA